MYWFDALLLIALLMVFSRLSQVEKRLYNLQKQIGRLEDGLLDKDQAHDLTGHLNNTSAPQKVASRRKTVHPTKHPVWPEDLPGYKGDREVAAEKIKAPMRSLQDRSVSQHPYAASDSPKADVSQKSDESA